jgi:hypothetical protein
MTIVLIFSGCIEENNAAQSNESGNLSSTTPSSEEENIPEIEVTSFSSIHIHDNQERVYDYLFSWDDVPGSENQELISYLLKVKGEETQKGLNVAENNALLVKSDDNKTISVYFTSRNVTKLTPEDRKKIVQNTSPETELELKEVNGGYMILITPHYIELLGKEVNGKLCVYKVEEKLGYNMTEGYYVAYNLSVKNNGSNNIDFKPNDLYIRDGDHVSNTIISFSELENKITDSNEILADLERENKIDDTTLFPGKTVNGSVIFQINSLYNGSFQLMYEDIPVISESFEKSIEAMSAAEGYNYSTVFHIPPYNDYYNGSVDLFEPNPESYPIYPNWINRSVFEFIDKADYELFCQESAKPSEEYIPQEDIIYALKVIPGRNITSTLKRDTTSSYQENYFIVVDDTGEELINTSLIGKIAILNNQTYKLYSEDMNIQQMNVSNATIVRISYSNWYETMAAHKSYIEQDIIIDDKMNIVLARYFCGNFFLS